MNVNANDIVFSQQWSAWLWVTPWEILILQFAAQTLAFAPIASSLKVFLAVALFLITAGALVMIGGFSVMYMLQTLPMILRNRSIGLLQQDRDARTLRRLQRRQKREDAAHQAQMQARLAQMEAHVAYMQSVMFSAAPPMDPYGWKKDF